MVLFFFRAKQSAACRSFLLVVLVWLYAGSAMAGDKLRISFGCHPLDSYSVGLLELALDQFDTPISLDVTHRAATQGRLKIDVMEGRYDIMWAANTKEDDTDMLPIRFPLFKGLLGYRVMIIHKKDQARFSGVRTLEDLRTFSMGQALDWADTGILRANGIHVIASSNYPSLFDMIAAGRFDAFPRGIMEPKKELASRDLPQLTIENELVLVYPMPFYFYVKKDNVALAHLIGLGLEKAIANGSFDEYFFTKLEQEFKLDLKEIKRRRPIYMSNPNLSPLTPIARKELWLYDKLGVSASIHPSQGMAVQN